MDIIITTNNDTNTNINTAATTIMASVMAAREIGEGLPVLFIHGWQMDGKVEEADFEPIFDNTTEKYLRIYVDLPGMGATPADGVKNQDDIFLRLVKYVETRLGQTRFLVVGTSCGAYLARALAQKYINQVDGLLLRVPLIEPADSKRDLDPFTPLVVDEQVMSSVSAEDKKQLLGEVPVQTAGWVRALKAKSDDFYLPAINASDGKVLDVIRADPQSYRLSFSLDDPQQQPRLPAPTLVVCGRHDGVVGYRDSLRLLDLYPRSTFVLLDRATHFLPVDEGNLFAASVQDWLVRVTEWRGSREKSGLS